MQLPEIWKAKDGYELAGTLIAVEGLSLPRTIHGVNVVDLVDDNGKRWTSPTCSKLSQLILEVTYTKGLLEPGQRIWFACEGELPSPRGKPYKEFSIRIDYGKGKTFERLLIKDQAKASVYRKMIRDGILTLEKALEYEEAGK